MSVEKPQSAAEVVQLAKTDVLRELGTSNPFLPGSWNAGLIAGYGNRIFDWYYALDDAERESLPDTAVRNLDRWASIFGITRVAGTVARGTVRYDGVTPTAEIPVGHTIVDSAGSEYTVEATSPLVGVTQAVTSVTSVGLVATVTTPVAHGLQSGFAVDIIGATPTTYNVSDVPCTVTSSTVFTYELPAAASSPATGTITTFSIVGSCDVVSNVSGEDQNQDADAPMAPTPPVAGISDNMRVSVDGIGGGTDQEATSSVRGRMLERIQDPIAHFNPAEITALAKTINGVTRVFVQTITPAVGQTTVYFMRDNDESGAIPDAGEVTAVKDLLLTILPAQTDPTDLVVAAPTAVSSNFTFTGLTPNTATMQAAITANLQQFFSQNTDVGVDVDEDAYRAAIFNTVDTTNGDQVTTFALSAPSGDISVSAGQIATLGAVVYP
jgi:uncharacterized phage protein gp47/JayE